MLAQEEQNRQLVLEFYDEFFNRHNVAEASTVIADSYRQHNPQVPDGKQPFVVYFAEFFAKNPRSHAAVVRSAANGDLVYLHVHSTNIPGDRGQAVMDIFRVSQGLIVEHWDVIQDVDSNPVNSNTMF